MKTTKLPPKALKAVDVGRYFIHLSNEAGKPITNKKLQKLVYYSQAWSLVLNDKKLFGEPIEAWVHGPAVRSLYVQYKPFGFGPIRETISVQDVKKISGKVKKLLDDIWQVYGKLDASYLEMLTHSEQPWLTARDGLQGHENSEKEISLDSMKSFYTDKLQKSKGRK
ncbi:MAG: putative prophage protein (ps3) [candidate division Kazan bacterium GW2011_GWA1_50_15]|uniref:Antitoxin SocA-like Panacea domain-containing protein n=2 Tax=Bacteria division Kazan-3B-28 TaxID=1798534 RepID=A0A0G1X841_UNCK3|nr:MAG: putative prophage protein (ps3) [candidate division Kazan bacterium GW2011_GWA1_50_15]KKW25695.1 MAG: hypothetical protein VE99_C0001G0334 [candidate division Kazan bacterium GW2011_GWC1_52_13]KKW27000.1 MAG: hypothetical protein VF00_C0002G0327 [candidate division Kazan bacterium GW2011_GWB1_52_7]